MGDERKLYGYQIRCMNEWCSGPEIHKWWCIKDHGELPEWVACPNCGWLADKTNPAECVPVWEEE